MSLHVPKRIVNEALQGEAFVDRQTTANFFGISLRLPKFFGGGSPTLFEGFDFDQTGYLLALS